MCLGSACISHKANIVGNFNTEETYYHLQTHGQNIQINIIVKFMFKLVVLTGSKNIRFHNLSAIFTIFGRKFFTSLHRFLDFVVAETFLIQLN